MRADGMLASPRRHVSRQTQRRARRRRRPAHRKAGRKRRTDHRRLRAGQRELGPRYRLQGSDRDFLRMNSNSYLSLANHLDNLPPQTRRRTGSSRPALRFIDGTFAPYAISKRASRRSSAVRRRACSTPLTRRSSASPSRWPDLRRSGSNEPITTASFGLRTPTACRRSAPFSTQRLADPRAAPERVPANRPRDRDLDGIFSMRGEKRRSPRSRRWPRAARVGLATA